MERSLSDDLAEWRRRGVGVHRELLLWFRISEALKGGDTEGETEWGKIER